MSKSDPTFPSFQSFFRGGKDIRIPINTQKPAARRKTSEYFSRMPSPAYSSIKINPAFVNDQQTGCFLRHHRQMQGIIPCPPPSAALELMSQIDTALALEATSSLILISSFS
jgi:hypothetical protein